MAGTQGEAQAIPDVAPLPCLGGRQALSLQTLVDRPQARSILPQYMMFLRQLIEEGQRLMILLAIGPIQTNQNLRQIGNRPELLYNGRL